MAVGWVKWPFLCPLQFLIDRCNGVLSVFQFRRSHVALLKGSWWGYWFSGQGSSSVLPPLWCGGCYLPDAFFIYCTYLSQFCFQTEDIGETIRVSRIKIDSGLKEDEREGKCEERKKYGKKSKRRKTEWKWKRRNKIEKEEKGKKEENEGNKKRKKTWNEMRKERKKNEEKSKRRKERKSEKKKRK